MDLTSVSWRKSSYSGGNGGQCVEVATITSHPDSPEPLCALRSMPWFILSRTTPLPLITGRWCSYNIQFEM